MTSATIPVSGQREPELAGQTVVVIGGSSGIGRGLLPDSR
jgi:NADPH:quinone reductase-like Zn-dependent oxidoreductase